MDHKAARRYRQQILFNNEDDVHFPTLTVNQTMKFALRNKVPPRTTSALAVRQGVRAGSARWDPGVIGDPAYEEDLGGQ